MTTPLSHLVVLDFEATCDGDTPPDPQEIIEFPSVLLDARTFDVVDEFEAFVRPVHHPTLSDFCIDLTGIQQAEVDTAPPFPEVFEAHLAWLESHGLPTAPEEGGSLPYALVTAGDWDLQTALPAQLRTSGIDFVPHAYRRWVNIKKPFKKWDAANEHRGSMVAMLAALDLELEGRHHRGIDDSRNIARIVRELAARGQSITPTRDLAPSRYPPITVTMRRSGTDVREVAVPKRVMGSLLGVASHAFGRGIQRAWLGDEAINDARLRDLRDGVTLRVE